MTRWLLTTIKQQTANIAANCIRSLLLQPSTTPESLSIHRHLFPRLVAFVTDVESEDPKQVRSLVAHTLCQYVGTLKSGQASAAMAMIIPTLMARATTEGGEVYQETSSRLLELAAVDQGAFKTIIGDMSGTQRRFLEEVITAGRQSKESSGDVSSGESGQPSITLKMEFGT